MSDFSLSDFILSELKENPDMIGDRNTDTAIDKTSKQAKIMKINLLQDFRYDRTWYITRADPSPNDIT